MASKKAEQQVQQAFQHQQKYRAYMNAGQPEIAETVQRKMVKGEQTEQALKEEALSTLNIQDPFIKDAMSRSMERIRDNNNILQLLPDMRLAIEIIIGGILSPKDFMTVALNYKSVNDVFDEKGVPILNYIENYFSSSYKLKPMLPKMLDDILARTGSYPLVTLPETSVDYLINSNVRITMESLNNTYDPTSRELKPMGILASKRTKDENGVDNVSMEHSVLDILNERPDFTSAPFDSTVGDPLLKLTVTDNFDALKLPSLARKVSTQKQQAKVNQRRNTLRHMGKDTLTYSSESMVKVSPENYSRDVNTVNELRKLYPERVYNSVPIQRVKPKSALDKPTMGHPLTIKLPTESVIPVFSPSDPSDHIGYFVVMDHTGNPVRMLELDNIYRTLMTNSNAGGDVTGYILSNAAANMAPTNRQQLGTNSAVQAYERAVPIYIQMVESELLDRLERGDIGTGVSIGKLDNVYRIMLARAMMGKKTQMLYVPTSLLSYLAIDFDEYGLGKTLLDDSKTLAALRAMQLFVNSMASAKNAITRRTLNVRLDEAEQNPQKAEEFIMHEFAKGTQAEYPMTNNPSDMINYLQRAGVNVVFAEHPLLPDTEVSVSYDENQYRQIDTDFDDYLKRLHSMALGLSPEVIEGAGSADFATQTIYANVMTARRIKGISEAFCHSLSGFVRRYIYNSQILMDDITGMIKENGWKFKNQFGEDMTDDEVAINFVESLEVSLPTPDTTSLDEQSEAFSTYRDFINDAMDVFFSTDFLTESDLGEMVSKMDIEATKNFMKAHFTREWMKENGIMTELFDLVSQTKDGKPIVDMLRKKEEYMESLSNSSILSLVKKQMTRASKINDELQKHEEGLNLSEGGSDYDDGGDTDDDFGGGDANFDDDFDMGETEETETEDNEDTDEGEDENSEGDEDETDAKQEPEV